VREMHEGSLSPTAAGRRRSKAAWVPLDGPGPGRDRAWTGCARNNIRMPGGGTIA